MNLRRIGNSLVTRLILFGVALVIAGAISRYFLLSRFLEEDLQRVVSAQQLALAESVAHDIDYKIEDRRQFLQQLAATLPRDLLDQPGRLGDWLGERYRLHPVFSLGLMVADSTGTVVADYPHFPGRVGLSIAAHPDYPLLRGGQSGIGRPVVGKVSGQAVLPMGVPIQDHDGRVRAALIGITGLNAPGFLDRITQGRIGRSGGFLLVAPRDHLIVASSDPGMVLKPTPPKGVNPLHDRAMDGYRGSGKTINAQGVEEISAMVGVPSTGWFVVARIPTAEALSAVARAQRYVIRHSFTASLIVLLVAGSFITVMLRPLYRAAAQAERMTRGEIPLERLPVVRDDEVGHLTMAFNRLLAKLASSQAELERRAQHDTLTGLPNRNLLADRLNHALAQSRRSGASLAVLFLDLDGFKNINDRYGHGVGDAVLREIALRLQAAVRASDTLARIGGDEFVLLAMELGEHPEESARALATKCIEAVAEQVHLHDASCTLGVSIGIALCRGECASDTLLKAADKAMYAAKERGRGCYVIAPEINGTTG